MGRRIAVGEIVDAFGIKGWVKIRSYTDPAENILRYSPWLLGESSDSPTLTVRSARRQGLAIVAEIEGVDDRDHALALKGRRIWVERDLFPQAAPGQYYWTDLIGARVVTTTGEVLGSVVELMETGANDVLVVDGEKERLIPFVLDHYVRSVDVAGRMIVVDWDPEF